MAIINIKGENLIEITTRLQRDNDMNFDEVQVIRLWDGFVYELFGNWKSRMTWNEDRTILEIQDDIASDCLVLRKRYPSRKPKVFYRNFDRDWPSPLEFVEFKVEDKKISLASCIIGRKEERRMYQMDHESITEFLRRMEKAFASKHLI